MGRILLPGGTDSSIVMRYVRIAVTIATTNQSR